MDTARYLIGEVSKITGLSKDTIHFYVKSGLLTPDYVDEHNRYRYYSRWNLWQLDIITICRKLSIPLAQIKKILSCHDNAKIANLLLEYHSEAVRLNRYYEQVAADILWYGEQNQRIQSGDKPRNVRLEHLPAETVIAGVLKRDQMSYHANLLEAARDELQRTDSIRRKYGYILDFDKMQNGKFIKQREYLKIGRNDFPNVNPKNLLTLPAGEYAVCILHIQGENANFQPLFHWLDDNRRQADAVFAEEIGLQLFDYVEYGYDCEIKAHLIQTS